MFKMEKFIIIYQNSINHLKTYNFIVAFPKNLYCNSTHKILFYRDHYRSQTTELLFQKMPNFTTNQKFLENFVLIFAKDNTDCFLFCNLGSTLLKREDLLKFVFFFEVAYLKIRSCAQCYCIWRFLVTNFTLLAFLVIFCPNLSFFENNSVFCDR